MKLWGRKRRLYQSYDDVAAQGDQVIQRDSVIDASVASTPPSQAWRSLPSIGLSLEPMSSIVNTNWGSTLTAWQDPTVTLLPLSHYKSPLAPNGEADGLATIKSPFIPPITTVPDEGARSVAELALPHRRPSEPLSSGNRVGSSLQRILSTSEKTSGQTSTYTSFSSPKQVVGYRPLMASEEPVSTTASEDLVGKSAIHSDTSAQSSHTYRDISLQRKLPSVHSRKPSAPSMADKAPLNNTLVRAQRSTHVFRSLKPIQLLGANEKNTSRGQEAQISSPSPLALQPESTQGVSSLGATKPTDSSNTQEAAPLISSREIVSTEMPATEMPRVKGQDAGVTPTSDLPLSVQRAHSEKQTPPFPLKLGSPIEKIPDSAVSFDNLGATKAAQQVPFILPERRQEDVGKVPEVPKREALPWQRPIPFLGPVPLQRLDLAKKATPAKRSENTLAPSVSKTSDTVATNRITSISEVSSPSSAVSPQPFLVSDHNDLSVFDRQIVPLVGFKKNLIENDYIENNYPNFRNTSEETLKGDSVRRIPPDSASVWQRTFTQPTGHQFFKGDNAELNNASASVFERSGSNFFTQTSNDASQLLGNQLLRTENFPTVPRTHVQRSVSTKPFTQRYTIGEPTAALSLLKKPVLPKWHTETSSTNLSVQLLADDRSVNRLPIAKRDDSRLMSKSIGLSGATYGSDAIFYNLGSQPLVRSTGVENNSLFYRQIPLQRQNAARLEPLSYPVQHSIRQTSPQSVTSKHHGEEGVEVPLQRFSFSKLAKKFAPVVSSFGNQLLGGSSGDTSSDTQTETEVPSSKQDGQQTTNFVLDLSQDDLRRLTTRIYPYISQKIKAEIEKDRERSGMITGLHR